MKDTKTIFAAQSDIELTFSLYASGLLSLNATLTIVEYNMDIIDQALDVIVMRPFGVIGGMNGCLVAF